MSVTSTRLLGALFCFVAVLPACGGGGDGGGGLSFTVTGVVPSVSDDLNGGDIVTITGTNFETAQVATVTFGASPGTSLQVISETELRVRTPPAPGGIAQTVTIEVTSILAGSELLFSAYTYQDGGATTPNPQTITPTAFTPTGAEDFTISGSNLGPPGGQVAVTFQGVGTVTGSVSLSGQFVTGRAPVSPGIPPASPIPVTIDTGTAQATVPTNVTYPFLQPLGIPIGSQAQPGNASEPVRLADGYAALCTAGVDGTWGNADDEVLILRGPPNAVAILKVNPRGTTPATAVGYLGALNSVPAVLGPDSFCVHSTGSPGGPGLVLVSNARTAPVADFYPIVGINAAPIGAIGPGRIAFLHRGADGVFGPPGGGNGTDEVWVMDFNLGVTPPAASVVAIHQNSGFADLTAGAANASTPFTADGNTVFTMNVGPDVTPFTADDTVTSVTVAPFSAAGHASARFLLGRPLAFSATLMAAVGAGNNGTAGDADDTLEVFSRTGAAWTRSFSGLGRPANVAALVPFARVGGGLALPVTGPTAVMIYTDVVLGTNAALQMPGAALLAPLGSGDLALFGPGADLTARAGGDDQGIHIPAAGTTSQSFGVPDLPQTVVVRTDADRTFGLTPGADGTFGTSDDILEVYQSRALSAVQRISRLPASNIAMTPIAPALGGVRFIPVGPGWGLAQSSGADRAYGTTDDHLILARY